MALLVACGSPSPEPAADCRPVEHVLGETCVPRSPERVVVLHDYLGLDAVIALGITPVGATGNPPPQSFPPWLSEHTDGITWIGSPRAPNLEKILQLQPDLILTLEDEGHEAIYGQLSQIAPTVIVPSQRQIFPELRFIAEVLGRQAEAEALIEHYHQRLAELRHALGERADHLEISLVRFLPNGARLEGDSYNVGQILKDVGLKRPPAQRSDRPQMISLEQIELIDGDVLLANTLSNPELESEANATLQRFQRSPLWSTLEAVQTDQVYVVDPQIWSGNGVLWTDAIIDDLFQYLVASPSQGAAREKY